MMLVVIITLIVAVSLGAYIIEMLGAVGQFDDPHDWVMEDEDDIEE